MSRLIDRALLAAALSPARLRVSIAVTSARSGTISIQNGSVQGELSRGRGSYVSMNDEQVLQLRRWAERLTLSDRADVRAAAKAILMLADEVEELRARPPEERDADVHVEAVTTVPRSDDASAGDFGSVLRGRLRSFTQGRLSKHGPEPRSEESSDSR